MPYKNKDKAKEYYKQYHLRTWSTRKIHHRELKQRRRAKLSEWLKTYKSNVSCFNCGETHPACLDFHHLNKHEKEGTVANMISEGYSTKSILFEIKKCIILCRNCHAKTHYNMKHSEQNDIEIKIH